MKIRKTKGGDFIQNWKEWPHSKRDWSPGRSKQSLAQFCFSPDAEGKLKDILSPVLGNNITFSELVAECNSNFDCHDNGRKHDLAIWGLCDGEKHFFIGIEAKVDEKFNDSISVNYNNAINNSNPRSGKKERMEELLAKFPSLTTDSEIPYQLLYSAAGTLSEIADVHVLVILVFHTTKCNEAKAKRNKELFDKFISAIKAKKIGDKEYYKALLDNKELNICYIDL